MEFKEKSNCIKDSVYIDDGFSGTDFNRPGVQMLLEDAKNGKIDCIIVKDFSRFGRDYMEVGAYLEQIFPFLGIRFISINDCYDSADGRGNPVDLDVAFKNLLYDLYSKDLSRKVKSALYARKEGGQYISANEPFGYEKAPDDRHMLVISEDEAEVVRRIFNLARKGVTSSQTAKLLNAENVPTPIEFKIRKGKASRKPKGDRFYWDSAVICSILRNPVYVGDMVYGKTKKEQVGGRNVQKDRADWSILNNHHAPVITREVFEEVQRSRGQRRGKGKNKGRRHPLVGLAVCGCCKRNLRIREGRNPYFTCQNRYVTGQKACVGQVNAMFLEQVVLFRLEDYLERQGITEDIYQNGCREECDKLRRKMEQAQQDYDRLSQEHRESYQTYALGEEAEFHSLHAQIERQKEIVRELQEQITCVEGQLRETKSGTCAAQEAAELTVEIAGRYIDKILVYSEMDIEITWKLIQ